MNRHILYIFCPKRTKKKMLFYYLKDVTTLEANEFCSIFRMNIFMLSSNNNNNTNGKLNEREQKKYVEYSSSNNKL